MNAEYRSFREFYPRTSRSTRSGPPADSTSSARFSCSSCSRSLSGARGRWLLLAPLFGYGLAWIGHLAFERNRPATFHHPFYSLAGDFAMFKDMLLGRLPW